MKLKTRYEVTTEGLFYNILKVPIFQEVKGDVTRGEYTKKDLKSMIEVFNEKKNNDWLPRVFIGHHDPFSTENRKGIGFLNNLILEEDIIYGDIERINAENYRDIKDLKYPYRSVEISGDQKEIKGLALLESQPPYFSFPLLNISEYSEKNKKINSYVNLPDDLLNGQCKTFSYIGKFFMEKDKFKNKKDVESDPNADTKEDDEEGNAEDKEEDKEEENFEKDKGVIDNNNQIKPSKEDDPSRIDKTGENKPISNKMEANDQEQGKEQGQEEAGGNLNQLGCMDVKLDKILQLLDKLTLIELKEHMLEENNGGYKMTNGLKPGSVTMQDEISSLKEQVSTLQIENKLNTMFSDASEIEYHKGILNLIPKYDDKEKYLGSIKGISTKFGGKTQHPALEALEKFGSTNHVDILNKFSQHNPILKKVAREALECWNDTMNHPNEKIRSNFKSQGWENPEDFVKHVVNMEEIQPNYLKTLTV